jgi:hypothetical protein
VEGLVTKSISGHRTENMAELYSTVAPEEQWSSIAKVIRLFDSTAPLGSDSGPQKEKTG